MRRRKEALVEAGATVSDRGWAIPPRALHQVFPETPQVTAHDSPADTQLVQELRDQIAWLRQQIEDQNRTIARQAEAHAVIAAKLTHQLDAADTTTARAAAEPEPEPSAPAARRWWRIF